VKIDENYIKNYPKLCSKLMPKIGAIKWIKNDENLSKIGG
jgi:hypothetical protein